MIILSMTIKTHYINTLVVPDIVAKKEDEVFMFAKLKSKDLEQK